MIIQILSAIIVFLLIVLLVLFNEYRETKKQKDLHRIVIIRFCNNIVGYALNNLAADQEINRIIEYKKKQGVIMLSEDFTVEWTDVIHPVYLEV